MENNKWEEFSQLCKREVKLMRENSRKKKKKFCKLVCKTIFAIIKPLFIWFVFSIILLFYKIIAENSCLELKSDFVFNYLTPLAKTITCIYIITFIYFYVLSFCQQKNEDKIILCILKYGKIIVFLLFSLVIFKLYIEKILKSYANDIEYVVSSFQCCFEFSEEYKYIIYEGIVICIGIYILYSICILHSNTNKLSIFLHKPRNAK